MSMQAMTAGLTMLKSPMDHLIKSFVIDTPTDLVQFLDLSAQRQRLQSSSILVQLEQEMDFLQLFVVLLM